jgi:VanZ family protein
MWRYSLPALVWSLVTTVLCLLPGKDLPEVNIVNFDKLGHLSVFGLLCLLYLRWYAVIPKKTLKGKLLIVTAVVLYGGLMELLQGAFYSDRTADWYDIAANSTGCLLALFVSLRN